MSSQIPAESQNQISDESLTELLSPYTIARDDHYNAPGFVVRPDDVQEVLFTLRDEAGFDHCSNVTAQEYEDRFESIYHLKKYNDPTNEVSIVVPIPRDAPVSQSAETVYRTADWHEREAYDLVGIHYENHPDLRRILLPETWQGHPMGLEYNQEKPQIVTLESHANPLEDDYVGSDTMFLNIGPHHPATHGVLHIETVLDGEQVVDVDPDPGYLHRCEEQTLFCRLAEHGDSDAVNEALDRCSDKIQGAEKSEGTSGLLQALLGQAAELREPRLQQRPEALGLIRVDTVV